MNVKTTLRANWGKDTIESIQSNKTVIMVNVQSEISGLKKHKKSLFNLISTFPAKIKLQECCM